MDWIDLRVVFLVMTPIVVICAAVYKFADFMEKREKAADEEFNRALQHALNASPQTINAYLQFKAEVASVLRQQGRKKVSLSFEV